MPEQWNWGTQIPQYVCVCVCVCGVCKAAKPVDPGPARAAETMVRTEIIVNNPSLFKQSSIVYPALLELLVLCYIWCNDKGDGYSL